MKFLYIIFAVLLTNSICCQNVRDNEVRLNFIIMIDDEILGLNISDGIFIIKDADGKYQDTFNFNYYTGDIGLLKEDYQKLFSLDGNSQVFVRFKFEKFSPKYFEKFYEYKINNIHWINKRYMMLKVYNPTKKNRRKYYFGDKKYITEFKSPNGNTIAVENN